MSMSSGVMLLQMKMGYNFDRNKQLDYGESEDNEKLIGDKNSYKSKSIVQTLA